MMSKPKYIVILTCLFCSVVASGTSHFYSFLFFINILARVDFWYDNLGLWLGKPSPGQKTTFWAVSPIDKHEDFVKINRVPNKRLLVASMLQNIRR